MKAQDINFGQQMQYNASTDLPLDRKYEGELVMASTVYGDLYFHLSEGPQNIVKMYMHKHALEEVKEDLAYYKDAILIRIDSINGQNVLFTMIKFSKSVTFSHAEELRFVINYAIDRDLKKENIRTDSFVDFFTDAFLVGDACFALTSSNMNKITLIGHELECTLQKTEQNIMQAISVRRHKTRNEIRGTIIMFKGAISFQDHLNNAQLSYESERKYRESLADTQELLKLWSLYSELEVEAATEHIEELGSIKYTNHFTRVDENGRLNAVFELERNPSKAFINTDIGYAFARESDFRKDDITKSRSYFLGTDATLDSKSHSGRHQLAIRLVDENIIIPLSGYLMGSFAGSRIMAQRREDALQKILNAKAPLTNLKLILQSGISSNIAINPKKAVTDDLLKKIFGSKKITFTERQHEAIEIAINTPDIAIIQGPPGTGKTTVIRAIIARLNMLYDGDVRILVSSAQHDAVDNAIENVEYGGLPVNRIGGRASDLRQKADSSILKWIEDVEDACERILHKEENRHDRKVIRSILMQLQTIAMHKEDVEYASSQLKQVYEKLCQLPVGTSFLQAVERMIRQRITVPVQVGNPSAGTNNEFVDLLKRQRLDLVTFLDDGRMQLGHLMRHCSAQLNLGFDVPDFWMDVRLAEEEELASLLPAFRQSIEQLLHKYDEQVQEVADEDLYRLNVSGTVAMIQSELERIINEQEKTVADAIVDLKDELENPSKISELIHKYTKVNAATCQQAVVKKFRGLTYNTETYDYVIIDEAARANPLDLLIPMSLGRKIILVGDHLQLPHLLEKDVVDRLIAEKNDPEIKELLDEPLFSRLYKMLEKTKYSSRKRTVMLKDQYRMHPQIASFVSGSFYGSELVSGVNEEQKSHDLNAYGKKPIAWLDVPKSLGLELSPNGQSKCRPAEVDRIMKELYAILEANDSYTIGIITFYKRQAVDIQESIERLSVQDQRRIEVGTVDSFQGKEFDIVFLSTVRANNFREGRKRVGFLNSSNRLNVAFSRSKRLLVVVGDTETVTEHGDVVYVPSLHQFKIHCQKEGYYE